MEERTSFFERGRDYESRYVNHRYLSEEKKTLSKYESVDYFSPHSEVYKEWVSKQPGRFEWDRWLTMGCIGFLVGLTAFFMHQGINLISENMHDLALRQIEIGDILGGWAILTAISVVLVIVSSAIVVLCCPAAGGSGLPELIAYLNGTNVRRIFSLRTYIVKFVSCLLAVGSGLPVGPEGPMIALGGLIGASVSQFKSKMLKIDIKLFTRLRNSEDRRNFLTAGAGAGVSAAFGAPVGGLLFAMEEVSSFWSDKLGWQTFFCCMVSAFTADLFNSAFEKFEYTGNFGLFQKDNYIIFHVENYIPLNLLVFIPAILLGGIGGLLGALFTFLNLKIVRLRRWVHEKASSRGPVLGFVKIVEPILIIVIVSTLKVLISDLFPCILPQCIVTNGSLDCLGHGGGDSFHTELTVETFSCPHKDIEFNQTEMFNGTFNAFATVFFSSGEEAIHHLFSRQTHNELPPLPLAVALLLYFPLACWTAGTSLASGLVVPMLLIGGLFGRLIGCLAVTVVGVHTSPYWAWLDPGAFALIGAASFFGGVSRLTMSLAVILMEMTNDIQFLLPIMVTIMVSKWVGDLLTHSFYHALLEVKCIPFLDSEPFITSPSGEAISLELFNAGHAMSNPVKCVQEVETVSNLSRILLGCEHSGFPVVNNENKLIGSVTRRILSVVLEFSYDQNTTKVSYDEFLQHDPSYRQQTILENLSSEPEYNKIDLGIYINQSAVSVTTSFSLHRTYVLFRTLGLRHLIVTDENNVVQGMISRKDLMGHALEDKLGPIISDVIPNLNPET